MMMIVMELKHQKEINDADDVDEKMNDTTGVK